MEQAGIISEGSMVPGLLPSPLHSLLLLALTRDLPSALLNITIKNSW